MDFVMPVYKHMAPVSTPFETDKLFCLLKVEGSATENTHSAKTGTLWC